MNIISSSFKNIYKQQIDYILASDGLTNSCTLYFDNGSADYCNNCVYDTITKISSNIYNNSGPQPFPEYTICPVCMGMGVKKTNTKTKKIFLAVIFDSKFFINLDSRVTNIATGTIQSICSKNLTLDIRNSTSMSVDNMPSIMYERIEDVNPVGLGDLNYIITTWKRL